MKNLKEEISKINKMIKSLNEQSYEMREFDDSDEFNSKMGDIESESKRDEEIEKIFMDCLERIKETFGSNLAKEEYIRMLDKYFEDSEDQNMDDEQLPY